MISHIRRKKACAFCCRKSCEGHAARRRRKLETDGLGNQRDNSRVQIPIPRRMRRAAGLPAEGNRTGRDLPLLDLAASPDYAVSSVQNQFVGVKDSHYQFRYALALEHLPPRILWTWGFALIELLVVIAIIANLAPCCCRSWAGRKKNGRSIYCMNNMKRWMTALRRCRLTVESPDRNASDNWLPRDR